MALVNKSRLLGGPYRWATAITPHASTNFTEGECANIFVGGTGNVVVVFKGGDTATFVGVPAGTWLNVQAIRVNAVSTTATSMLAAY